MFTTKKIALVSVINDLVTDNRVNRNCTALVESGYDVLLTGRALPNSLQIPINWPFKAHRMKLLFKKGPAFYLFFNVRLFWFLLFKKADLLFANDLDTLLPNYLVSKIKGIPLIYDSHELFCEVPELQKTPFKRKIWMRLENWIVPQLKNCITVNQSIAGIFEKQYAIKFVAVRNISEAPKQFVPKLKAELGLPLDKHMVLLQGAGINVDRGAEELIDAMTYIDNAVLYIVGGGDVWPVLQSKIEAKQLKDKVILINKIPKSELLHYTFNADLGLSIDKDNNPNYHFSLPNKIFDYLQAGVPILASRLPEIENVINTYGTGDFITNHEPASIAVKIKEMLLPQNQARYRLNMQKANEALNWNAEKIKLMEVIARVKN
ncbi:MAG: glycosyltransferase [Bacteroidia bacterium]|nr:glycosyltransferase [Bacteroidia bacterium]